LRVFHSLCSRKRKEPQRYTSNATLQNYNIHGFGMEEKRPKVIIVHESHDYNSSYGGAGVDSWTPDSQAILFTSSRNGRAEVFRKGLNENIDEALVRGPESYWLPGWVSLPMIRPCPYATLDPRMCTRLTGRQCSCKFRLFDLAAFPFPCLRASKISTLNTEHCATTPPTRRRRFRYGSHVFPAHPRRGDICRAAVGKTKSPDAAPLGLEAFSSRPPTLLRHYRARPSSTT